MPVSCRATEGTAAAAARCQAASLPPLFRSPADEEAAGAQLSCVCFLKITQQISSREEAGLTPSNLFCPPHCVSFPDGPASASWPWTLHHQHLGEHILVIALITTSHPHRRHPLNVTPATTILTVTAAPSFLQHIASILDETLHRLSLA